LKRKGADYHHGDLRRSLVEATIRLVADYGVDGFTLRAAAKLAGVSDGAPYHHFADKEALLAAVAEESFELLCDEMNAAGNEYAGDACAKARAMSVAYVLFAAKYPARFRIMFTARPRGRRRHPGLERVKTRADRLLRRCLDQSLRTVANRAVPERSITLARAVVHGLSVLTIDGHLRANGLGERSLKRIAWDALRQLHPNERLDLESPSGRGRRASIAPESAPRSGNRVRVTRQIA
jgi:AcrR family transcriptional regulator